MGQQSGELLPDYGRCYFGHVVAEYKTAGLPSSPIIDEILDRFAKDPQSIGWSDLYTLEKAILRLQPFNSLRRRAWSLRDKYREVAGAAEYDAYLASHPPNENEKGVDPDDVRADLEHILGALHWNYSLIPLREGLRGTIINRIALGILITGLVVLTLTLWSTRSGEWTFSTLFLVAFAGCLGGFVSMQRRIGQIPRDGDPLLSIFQLNSGLSTLYLSPVSGAIFALLLYFIFKGGLVTGSVFPDMHNVSDFEWRLDKWGEPAAVAFGLLLVWSFIAGFAERFVPDILDRLVTRGQTSTQLTPSPAPPFTNNGSGNGGNGKNGQKNSAQTQDVQSPESPEETPQNQSK